ncbi:trypsin-1-like [Acropora muricata]|uniref:trypsin-1-like n=1 Tax=Acropora muricata TaxID=159855 RepID=UPI0034E610B7
MMPKTLTFLLLFYMSQITQAKKEPVKKSIRDDVIIRAFIEARPRHKRGAQCKDTVSYCDSYRAYCSDPQYKDYLEANCKNTCGFCEGAQCKDTISYCNSYQAYCSDPQYKDYLQANCKNTCGFCEGVGPTPSVSTTPPRTELPIDQGDVPCGKRGVHYRIVGGKNALPGNWPWQVTMDYFGESNPHWCGGSIVTPNWILTAAHCFDYGDDMNAYSITAGEYNLNGLEGYEQNVTVEKIFKHPDYDGRDFDVALVKLNTTIKYNSHVRPVCLPKTDLEPQTICYVTGWGHTSEGGNIARILQQATVPLVSRETCQKAYGDLGYNITKRMRCAGYAEGNIDACQGDSGGPLVCHKDHSWYLMGVVSWGVGCARKGRYGVYADMMEAKYWVQKTINEN